MAIQDSGARTHYDTGAVRDITEGKGRCDLMPIDAIAESMESQVLSALSDFIESGYIASLLRALTFFLSESEFNNFPNMYLEVSKHFEEGAKKYGENNWQKGIPVQSYIDSAIRHYLKYKRGDTDERHDRAFVWNILCLIWTLKHVDAV